MKPVPDWRRVLRHAWSIRLLLLAALLSGAEAVLPLIDALPIPPWGQLAIAIATPIVVASAFAARLVAQKEFEK